VPSQLDLEAVRATFPDWRLYHISGNWHAFRSGVAMLDGPWSLLPRHLHAATLPDLAERLCLQAHLDDLSDQELAEVWQQMKLPEPTGQGGS
jgi:hypothetical protein